MSMFANGIMKKRQKSDTQNDILPKISAIPSVVLISLITFCSVYVSLYRSEVLAAVVIFLISLFMIYVCRSFKVFVILAVPCVMILGFFQSFVPLAVILSAIVIIGLGAFLINLIKKMFLIALIPIIYAVSVLLSGSFRVALFSIICILPAIILAFSLKHGRSRADTIVRTSLAIALPLIICFVLWVYVKQGSIYFSAFNSIMHSTNDSLAAYLAQLHFSSMGEDIYIFNKDAVETVSSLLMNIIPAVFIVCCNLIAFFSNVLFLTLYKINKLMTHLSIDAKRFKLSTVSAVIFIGAYIAILLFSNDYSTLFWAVVAQNVYLVLLAPFAYVGMIVTISKIVTMERRKKSFLFILIAAVFLFAPVMIIVAAYIGIFHTIFSNRKKNKESK